MLGDLYIANQFNSQGEPTGWLDCWYEWGVGLEDGALDVLMTFRPNKEPVVNKNVTAQGAYYVTGGGLVDERTVSVPFHIVAANKADFLLKRNGFYNAIKGSQQGSLLVFQVANPVEVTYKMYYVSCTQYTQFLNGMAKFMLTLYETGNVDGEPALPEPMPLHQDMEAYLLYLLQTYGGLATEEEVRDIVRNYSFDGHTIQRWPLDNR